jgi:hypothetical protein
VVIVSLTKKYKYKQSELMNILTDVRGETIKNIGLLMVLAVAALFSVPALAEAFGGSGAVDVLGDGIFETEGSSFKFPVDQDTSVDTLAVGDDKALAFGMIWGMDPPAVATNNLEIKKNQDSGDCKCCCPWSALSDVFDAETTQPADGVQTAGCGGTPQGILGCAACQDCCKKMNIEQITVGDRDAMAFGFATATNNVKIVTNQQ